MRDIQDLCRDHGLLAVYLFGSRSDDGQRVLRGEAVEGAGSDLDVGIVFDSPSFEPIVLSRLQVAFEDVFAPLRVDLVPLQRVDPLFAYRAIIGIRIADMDQTRVAEYELGVMRVAAELLPVQRRLEREIYGTSTS